MSLFSSFEIFMRMLFGSGDLCELKEDIIRVFHFLSVGVKKKVFVFV